MAKTDNTGVTLYRYTYKDHKLKVERIDDCVTIRQSGAPIRYTAYKKEGSRTVKYVISAAGLDKMNDYYVMWSLSAYESIKFIHLCKERKTKLKDKALEQYNKHKKDIGDLERLYVSVVDTPISIN